MLWLLEAGKTAAKNLRHEAQARGVDPSRLIFAERMEAARHLARQRHADLFLDTFHCNAHTTASDALWSGVPVLTKNRQELRRAGRHQPGAGGRRAGTGGRHSRGL